MTTSSSYPGAPEQPEQPERPERAEQPEEAAERLQERLRDVQLAAESMLSDRRESLRISQEQLASAQRLAAEEAEARAVAERTAADLATQLAEARAQVLALTRDGTPMPTELAAPTPDPEPPPYPADQQPAPEAPGAQRRRRSWFRSAPPPDVEEPVEAPAEDEADVDEDEPEVHDEPDEEPDELTDDEPDGLTDDEQAPAVEATTPQTIAETPAEGEPVSYRCVHNRRGTVLVAGAVAGIGGAVVLFMVLRGELVTPAGIGLAIVALMALGVVLRAAATSRSVTLENGQLEVVSGETRHRFDLTSEATVVEVRGAPGDPDWRMLLLREGRRLPVEITPRSVDPQPFTEAMRQWRPDL